MLPHFDLPNDLFVDDLEGVGWRVFESHSPTSKYAQRLESLPAPHLSPVLRKAHPVVVVHLLLDLHRHVWAFLADLERLELGNARNLAHVSLEQGLEVALVLQSAGSDR